MLVLTASVRPLRKGKVRRLSCDGNAVHVFAPAAAEAVRLMEMWAEAAEAFDKVAMALTALGAAMSMAVNGFSVAEGFPQAVGGYDDRAV
ncbi:hypothetical protein [Streptomyces sp. NPDC003480]